DLRHERVPRVGLAPHDLLRSPVIRALPAFDEVARDRERRAREPDERRLAVELAPDEPHGIEHVAEPLGRLEDAEPIDVLARSDGRVDDRALALRELERRAHRLERQEDVGEEDRRIEAELERLERDLEAELRRLADLEERVLLAEGAV